MESESICFTAPFEQGWEHGLPCVPKPHLSLQGINFSSIHVTKSQKVFQIFIDKFCLHSSFFHSFPAVGLLGCATFNLGFKCTLQKATCSFLLLPIG